MTFYLGFDGGGTKTDCVLMDETGRVVTRATGGPSNPLRAGYPSTWHALGATADAVLAAGHLKSKDIRGVCAGLAGTGQPVVRRRVEAYFHLAFPAAEVCVTTDLEIALEAAVGAGEGVVLIGGTGSAAFGRDAKGRTARSGGWGPWIGDEGSAFESGRQAFAAVARAEEQRGPQTMLGALICEAFQVPDWWRLMERIAKHPDNIFPRIFPLLFAAANQEDAVARQILSDSARELAALAQCVLRNLGLVKKKADLAKIGGIFWRNEFFDRTVDEALARVAPHAVIVRTRITPAHAGAERARRKGSSSAGGVQGNGAGEQPGSAAASAN
jgi:glucosamine kinase